MDDDAEPLDDAHHQVDGSAGVRGTEFTDEVVEFAASGTDAEEEGDFDEEDYEGAGTIHTSVSLLDLYGGG